VERPPTVLAFLGESGARLGGRDSTDAQTFAENEQRRLEIGL